MKNERERERKRGKGFLTENRVKKNNTIKKLEGRKLSCNICNISLIEIEFNYFLPILFIPPSESSLTD